MRVAANGGYFSGNTSLSLVAEAGVVRASNASGLTRSAGTYYPTRGAFGRLRDGRFDVAWVYNVSGATYAYPNPAPNTQTTPAPVPTATYPAGGAPWPVAEGIGGGPVLVAGGAKRITFDEEVIFGSGVADSPTSPARGRTGIGYTAAGEVLLIVAPDGEGLTINDLADLFVGLGASEALNLDGGGSSQLVVGSTVLYNSGRPVPSAVVFGPRRTVAAPAQTYDFDADPASPNYRERGAWTTSANAPYFGAVASRLNAADGAGDRAVFRLNGIPAGTYTVTAYWTASSNRATNTPFTLYRAGTPPTTVRLSQQSGTSGDLGTFALAPGDSLAITDDASPSASFVVADGVRLTRVPGTAVEPLREAHATFRLFPNPASSSVTIDLAPASYARTGQVYDLLGRSVARFDVPAHAGLVPVALGPWPAGLYVVAVGAARATLVVRP